MKRPLAVTIGLAMTLTLGLGPASAVECTPTETESVRSLFVPVIRISAHQGRNVEQNHKVVAAIKDINKSISSTKLKQSLTALKTLVEQGELNKGSTEYWGYREGSAWKTYKAALTITQKNLC